jgi:CDP-diacylglycerol--serine O-phosphatidyltransferase
MVFNRRILIPNALTAANMALGFVGIVLASKGMVYEALVSLFVASLFDMADGRVARMLNATSDFGVQFDSFSDVISFGVAPAFIIYQACFQSFPIIGAAVGAFYMLCGVFRLARFNLDAAKPSEANSYFKGLPIPYAAGHVGALVLMRQQVPSWAAAILTVVVGLLMASRLKLPSFKKNAQWVLYALVANSAAVVIYPSWPTFLWWIGCNVVSVLVTWIFARKADRETAPTVHAA